MKNCYFCKEALDYSSAKERLPKDWPYDDEIIYHDDNIFSIVGSGPQVVPYVLILPKRHIFSTTQMNTNEWNSFINCLDFLIEKGGYDDELCIFEHSGESSRGSSSIDHCHIHIIKGELGLYHQKEFDEFLSLKNVKNHTSIPGENYLMIGKYKDSQLDIKISTDSFSNEQQYFRKALSRLIGEDDWNWRDHPKEELMLKIMNEFKCQGRSPKTS
jgi:diadenosine tetraphosphate (Ap4A) HIT family hydrolase